MLLFLSAVAFAFPDEVLIHGRAEHWFVDGAGTTDGGLVAVGRVVDEFDQSQPLVTAIDADGAVAWALGDDSGLGYLTRVAARGAAVASCGVVDADEGDRPLFWVGDDGGAASHFGQVGGIGGTCFDLHWSADDLVVLAGFSQEPTGAQPWIMWWRVDEGLVQERRLDATTKLLSLVPLDDGAFIGVGYQDDSGAADAWLARIEADGELTWSHFVGGEGDDRLKDAVLTDDGDVIACGYTTSTDDGSRQAWVARYGPDGSQRWSLTPGWAGDEGFKDLHWIDDETIHLVGDSTSASGDWDLYAADVSIDGDLLAEWVIDEGGDDLGYTMATLTDGTAVYVGTRDSEWGIAGWAVRVHRDGGGGTTGEDGGSTGDGGSGDGGSADGGSGDGGSGDGGSADGGSGDGGADGAGPVDPGPGRCGCGTRAGFLLPVLLLGLRRRS